VIVRKIRPGEYKRCQQLCALAFEYEMKDAALSPEALLEKVKNNPRSMQDAHWDSQWAAFEDDDQTMMATMTVIPWCATFDGQSVCMAGIGGVASLPQYRRSGAIRACFEAMLRENCGFYLSYLYPFSTEFYRKFGYELGCDWVKWRLRLAGMPRPDVAGSWKLAEPGSKVLADIVAVDRLREARYNCMVRAGASEYLFLRDDPFVTRRYCYVYYNAEGVPKGWMTVAPGNGEMDCPRFVFNDREGFLGLLALLMRLSADHSHATIYLPDDVELRGDIPEWSFGNVTRDVEQKGMVRAMNVQALLGMARMRGEGSLRIAVNDPQIPENTGCFEVSFGREEQEAPAFVSGALAGHLDLPEPRFNGVRRVEDAPDIELTIQDFSRLIVGCCDLDPEWLPDVKLHCPVEQAAQVFYRKPTFISAFF